MRAAAKVAKVDGLTLLRRAEPHDVGGGTTDRLRLVARAELPLRGRERLGRILAEPIVPTDEALHQPACSEDIRVRHPRVTPSSSPQRISLVESARARARARLCSLLVRSKVGR